MSRLTSQSFSAFAAVLMMVLSINAVVTVPPAHAHSLSAPVLA